MKRLGDKKVKYLIHSLSWKNSKHSEVETDELTRNSSLHMQVTLEKAGVSLEAGGHGHPKISTPSLNH